MSPFENIVAAVRFGTGSGPAVPAVTRSGLYGDTGPVEKLFMNRQERLSFLEQMRTANKVDRKTGSKLFRLYRAQLRQVEFGDLRARIAGQVTAGTGFSHRLTAFWDNHFAVEMSSHTRVMMAPDLRYTLSTYLGGYFADMLVAAVTHPAMLSYLDQNISAGPNSPEGKKGRRGLNENLAREILELHTLGVGAGYTQKDVTHFAELLTGLDFNTDGFVFSPRMAEPGPMPVLGRSYATGPEKGFGDIEAALRDIASRPETARYLSRKLVRFFIADDPPESIAGACEEAWRGSNGHLPTVYRALLDHPDSWRAPFAKARTPEEFVVASLRALNPPMLDAAETWERKQINSWLIRPLTAMGQPYGKPPGPDGWPDEATAWITPPALAARIEWAFGLARDEASDTDPRVFVETALGPLASPTLRRAVAGAETRPEGVALVLASPAFNRR